MYISHSGDNKLRNFLPDSWPVKRKSKSSRHFPGYIYSRLTAAERASVYFKF